MSTFVDKLKDKGADTPCEACGQHAWIEPLPEGAVTKAIIPLQQGSLSVIYRICGNCRLVRLHAG